MISSLKAESLATTGARQISATAKLLPVPLEDIKFEDDLLIVSFPDPINKAIIDYPGDTVCVVYMEYMDEELLKSKISYLPIKGTTVVVGLPATGLKDVKSLYVGYSNGLFSGCTEPYYLNSIVRQFFYYDTCTFDTYEFKYHGYGDLSKRVILRYRKDAYTYLYIGYEKGRVGGDFTIGGLI